MHKDKEFHQRCLMLMKNFVRTRSGERPDVRKILQSDLSKRADENRAAVASIIDTVVPLARQNIAFRGDTGEIGMINHQGIEPLDNDGNFRSILRMRIRSGDTALTNHAKNAPKMPVLYHLIFKIK